MTLFKSAPMEMGILTALTVGMPVLQGAITGGITKIFEKVAGGLATGGGAGGFMAGLAKAIPLLLRFAGVLGGVILALQVFGGGLENSARQIQESTVQSFSSLSDITRQVIEGFGKLSGDSQKIGGNFDLLSAILLAITAPLDLIQMAILGIRTGFDNLAVGLNTLRIGIAEWLQWLPGGKERLKELKENQKELLADREETTKEINRSRIEDDVYYTSIRYGGRENYANALRSDIKSKQDRMGRAGILESERKKLNDDLYVLKRQLAVASRSNPTTVTPPKPGAPKPAGGAPAAGGAPVTITPQALAPVTTATNAVNTTTAAVNSSTQGVRGAVSAADTAAKATAAKHTAQYTQLLAVLNSIKSAVMVVSNKLTGLKTSIDQRATQASLAQVLTLMQSGKMKVQADFNMPGGPLGGGQGGPAIFGAAASKFGLTMTSGYRPGDPGYHGINRARDYSNGSAPTPQMMMFAQYLANNFGSGLKELIYTPLGWSIKDGRKVPAYARAGHYDHVHVAWAGGIRNPRFFDSAAAARQYESMYAPAGARIQTATWNSAEGRLGGGPTTVNQNITISGADDPRRLAEMVFNYAAQAAEHVNNSSFA
jgi:hypothetical protein